MKNVIRLFFIIAVLIMLPGILRAQQHSLEILATFVYPHPPDSTYLNGISNNGITAGYSISETVQSFTRSARGVFSSPITSRGLNVFAEGVNNSGLVCGYTEDTNDHHGFAHHGFFFQNNILTTYDAPDATETDLYALNDGGNFVGSYSTDQLYPSIPFKSINGIVTTVEVPGAVFAQARGINNLNQLVGLYTKSLTPIVERGFFQNANGVTTLDVGYLHARTYLQGINDQGVIVGYYLAGSDLNPHGLLVESLTTVTTLDVPGAKSTQIHAINNLGLVAGIYISADGTGLFGFIARIR